MHVHVADITSASLHSQVQQSHCSVPRDTQQASQGSLDCMSRYKLMTAVPLLVLRLPYLLKLLQQSTIRVRGACHFRRSFLLLFAMLPPSFSASNCLRCEKKRSDSYGVSVRQLQTSCLRDFVNYNVRRNLTDNESNVK